ncbi:hypothetical protein ABIG06_001466 [Bradyrhizobium sp. USDA 326]
MAMDLFALRYWKPSTWSKPDIVLLLPALLIGIGCGYLLFRVLDHCAVAIVMAVVTLIYVSVWFVGGSEVTVRPHSSPKAVAAGLAPGVTTIVAHSRGPYICCRLSKEVDVGTTSLIMLNPASPSVKRAKDMLQQAATRLGVQFNVLESSSDAEIEKVYATLKRGSPLLIGAAHVRSPSSLIALSAKHGIPAMYDNGESADAGGLQS